MPTCGCGVAGCCVGVRFEVVRSIEGRCPLGTAVTLSNGLPVIINKV